MESFHVHLSTSPGAPRVESPQFPSHLDDLAPDQSQNLLYGREALCDRQIARHLLALTRSGLSESGSSAHEHHSRAFAEPYAAGGH